ncbi:MAG: glycosyltransferase [Chloroflexota bacterium]
MNQSKILNPIKVLWVLPTLEGGGAERAIVTILKHLDRTNIEPILCLFYRRGVFLKEVEEAGIPIVSLENGRFPPTTLYKLTQTIRQLKPNITIGVLRRCSMLTTLAHKLSGHKGRVFINEQNTPSVEMKQFGNEKLKRLGYKPFLQMADGVLAISEGITKDLVTHFQMPSHKIKVIPNPVEIKIIQEKAQKKVAHPWFDTKFHTIVSVGRLHPQKGHDILIEAFATVKTAVSNAKLVIVGQGPEQANLSRQITQLNLDDSIDLVGFQDNPYTFMAQADLFVLASRYEGFGIVLAEALALNMAVIATNCPSGPADILDHGKAGILVESEKVDQIGTAIINHLQNPDSSELKKQYALSHVAQFSETAVANQYINYFKASLQ